MPLTQEQINEIRAQDGLPPVQSSQPGDNIDRVSELNAVWGDLPKEKNKGLKGVSVGIAKGLLQSVTGLGTLTSKGLSHVPGKVGEAFAGGAQMGEEILQGETLKAQGAAEKIGKGIEQIAEFTVPESKVAKVTEGLSLIPKIATRVLTSGGIATAQQGEIGADTAIAAGTEAAFPIAGKAIKHLVANPVARLMKGLATGFSGVSSKSIDEIISNPEIAKESVKLLEKEGNAEMLKKNVQTIVNGVSQIRKEARNAYKEGVQALKDTDIDPKVFRSSIQKTLDKYGSYTKEGERILSDVEFDDPKNLKKASSLIDSLQKVNLDGRSLDLLADKIESTIYKTATSDERLAYNAFAKDLANSLRSAINDSTTKLKEINSQFSKDIQLSEAIEDILGKVKYKNMKEFNKISQKLESIFSQKGLSPEYVDNFFTRLGLNPSELKTSEAVRQISDVTEKANTPGESIGELFRNVTASILTPKMVRDLSIYTGMTAPKIQAVWEALEPTGRAAFIKALTSVND